MSIAALPWNLDAHMKAAQPVLLPPPTGSKLEQARELLKRAEARDASCLQDALDAERAGDE